MRNRDSWQFAGPTIHRQSNEGWLERGLSTFQVRYCCRLSLYRRAFGRPGSPWLFSIRRNLGHYRIALFRSRDRLDNPCPEDRETIPEQHDAT